MYDEVGTEVAVPMVYEVVSTYPPDYVQPSNHVQPEGLYSPPPGTVVHTPEGAYYVPPPLQQYYQPLNRYSQEILAS